MDDCQNCKRLEAEAKAVRHTTIEECAKVADHQATICGMSQSRISTALDIATNIRALNSNQYNQAAEAMNPKQLKVGEKINPSDHNPHCNILDNSSMTRYCDCGATPNPTACRVHGWIGNGGEKCPICFCNGNNILGDDRALNSEKGE